MHDLLSSFVPFTACSMRGWKQGLDNVMLYLLLMHTLGSFSVACFKTNTKTVKKANKGQHLCKLTRTQSRNKWIVWGAGKREWKTHDLFGVSIWLVDWLFNAGFLVQSHIVEGETHWSAGIAFVSIENFLIWKWEISMLFFFRGLIDDGHETFYIIPETGHEASLTEIQILTSIEFGWTVK